MATTSFHSTQVQTIETNGKVRTTSYVTPWAVIAGRALFSAIFILSSFHHFSGQAISMAMDQGVPFANLLVPFSGLMSLAGGLSILFGYKEKLGALLIMVFLVPVTLMMHNFWAVYDPGLREIQMANFLKNVALFGSALLIYQFAPVQQEREESMRRHLPETDGMI